jgi:hypothetical protein
MGARLSKDERRAVAQRIFTALCAHYPDRHIALFERPQADISSAERVVANTAVAPSAGGIYDGADSV